MTCPHCHKIIAEGSTYCPFCGAQATAPQEALGGFLKFLVILWKYVFFFASFLFCLSMIARSVPLFQAALQNGFSWATLKPVIFNVTDAIWLVILACLYRRVALRIESGNPAFLGFWQKLFIVQYGINLLHAAVLGESVSGIVMTALWGPVMFLLLELYFTKSQRLYTFMGSDAYLRQSLFNKNTSSPISRGSENTQQPL